MPYYKNKCFNVRKCHFIQPFKRGTCIGRKLTLFTGVSDSSDFKSVLNNCFVTVPNEAGMARRGPELQKLADFGAQTSGRERSNF